MAEPALERLFHDADSERFLLLLRDGPARTALELLEPWSRDEVDLPETYPTGI